MERILENTEETSSNCEKDGLAFTELTDEIKRLLIGGNFTSSADVDSAEELKIKFQYMDDVAALNLKHPVDFNTLLDYFQRRFRRHLNIYYTTSSRELMIQIKNQDDLDHVIDLHKKGGSKRRMRLLLARKKNTDELRSKISAPSYGLYHGIQETSLSETSSVFSASSTSYSAPRLNRYSAEDDPGSPRIRTPNPPSSWRESRCLGRGMFGHVYVCLNADTNEQLVVKKIYLNRQIRNHQGKLFACLENEVALLSSLSHPHIVQYHGCVKLQDCFCIFMELMTGGSLKEQITDTGPLSEGFTVDFTAQILSGLVYLHSKSIIHRDIKSANILRHAKAHVKIGDFGSANYLQALCTEQGVDIHGTPHYTAPEIITNSRRFDQRSDIWSLGITVIEMLTSRTPWADLEPGAVHIKIAFEDPEYDLPAGTSDLLKNAVRIMLRRKPEDRLNAAELLETPPFNFLSPN